jgi:hypothetical protein
LVGHDRFNGSRRERTVFLLSKRETRSRWRNVACHARTLIAFRDAAISFEAALRASPRQLMVGHDMLREFRDFIEEFGIRATGVWAQLADLSRKFGAAPEVQHRVRSRSE